MGFNAESGDDWSAELTTFPELQNSWHDLLMIRAKERANA